METAPQTTTQASDAPNQQPNGATGTQKPVQPQKAAPKEGASLDAIAKARSEGKKETRAAQVSDVQTAPKEEAVEDGDSGEEAIEIAVRGGKTKKFTRDELIKHAQRGEDAQHLYDQAKAIREEAAKERAEAQKQAQQMQEFWKAFKENPRGTLKQLSKHLGFDTRQIAEEEMLEHLSVEEKMANLTPEQRQEYMQLLKDQGELGELRKWQQAEKERYEQHQNALETRKAAEQYEKEVMAVLQEGKLPADAESVGAIASLLMINQAGAKDESQLISPKEAAEWLSKNIDQAAQKKLSVLEGQELVDYIGKENAEKIRKYYLAQVQKSPRAPKPQQQQAPEKGKPHWFGKTEADFNERIKRALQGD